MIGYLKKTAVANLVSPYGLAIVSCAIFLAAWSAPPALFMEYAGEPDFLYLSPAILLFYAACVAMFLAGVSIVMYFVQSDSIAEPIISVNAPLGFILFPLAISTLLCLVSIVVLDGKVSNFISLLFSQQGALIKLANASGQAEEGSWGYVVTFHTGILWWAYSRAQLLVPGGASQWIFRCCFTVAMTVGLLTAAIKVDRTNLIPIIAGVFIIYFYSQITRRDASSIKSLALGVGLGTALLIAFGAISYVRGAGDSRLIFIGIFDYTALSYNRLAAEIHGFLHYPFGGRGVYLSTFLAFNNTVNRIVPINDWMGGPTQRGVYFSEFSSIAASGLNPAFNWSGAFGYLFADLGWRTPLYLFPVGILNGYLWNAFREKSVAGLVLYPWAAFSILFWFGWNVLFDLRCALLVAVVAVLGLYEACLLGKHISVQPLAVRAYV